jgi:hypothetical protein
MGNVSTKNTAEDYIIMKIQYISTGRPADQVPLTTDINAKTLFGITGDQTYYFITHGTDTNDQYSNRLVLGGESIFTTWVTPSLYDTYIGDNGKQVHEVKLLIRPSTTLNFQLVDTNSTSANRITGAKFWTNVRSLVDYNSPNGSKITYQIYDDGHVNNKSINSLAVYVGPEFPNLSPQ